MVNERFPLDALPLLPGQRGGFLSAMCGIQGELRRSTALWNLERF
jgi:hypothetical protein